MPELTSDHLIQLSLLRDHETDALVASDLLRAPQRWLSPLEATAVFTHDELTLAITPGPEYPVKSVSWIITNHTAPIDVVDALRRQLRAIVAGTEDENSSARFVTWFDNFDGSEFEYTPVVTLLAEHTDRHLELFRAKRRPKQASTENILLASKAPADVATLSCSELAREYIGTPQDIVAHIPSGLRVLHIEEVIRHDLARTFAAHRESMRQQLLTLPSLRKYMPAGFKSHRHADHVEHLVSPKLTFHGTQRQYVPSIVRHGFLRPGTVNPGTNAEHDVRCGATYGQGIYSSPSAQFSLAYSDWTCTATRPDEYYGLKLIVCATVMGRSRAMFREDNWRLQTRPYWGADSHVGNNNLEYIVFEAAQILPVYVVHLDWGADNTLYFEDLPSDPAQWTERKRVVKVEDEFPGDRQRRKAAIMAKAAKYFPYGFGPATGTRFVVEEVADVSDDEEQYGDYQADRGDGVKNLDFWSWYKFGELEDEQGPKVEDEYHDELRAGPAWDSIPERKLDDL